MNRILIQRHLAYRLRRLGRAGLAGLALLAAALVYAILVLPAASAKNARLVAEISASADSLRRAQDSPRAGAPTTPGEQLQAFYEEFPKGATIPDWLEKIYAIAEDQQVALEVGEYTFTRSASGRLDKFKITFPLKASYPQLRQFITGALASAPALALDSLYLKRDKVGDGQVDARIVFLLYLEKSE